MGIEYPWMGFRGSSLPEKRLRTSSTRLNAEYWEFLLTPALKSIILYLQTINLHIVSIYLEQALEIKG